MVAVMDGRPIVERIKARAELLGLNIKGPVGVVSSFTKEMRVDVKDADNRLVIAVATTDDLDLESEVVLPDGADDTYFQKNKKVFVDHTYDSMHAIGMMRKIVPWRGPDGSKGWVVKVHVPESPDNPISSHVMALASAGGIGMSIGFEAVDYGRPTSEEQKAYPGAKSIVRRWNWIELSFTAMPCNVACQTLNGTLDTSKAAQVRELLTKSHAPRAAFRVFNLELATLEIPPAVLEIA